MFRLFRPIRLINHLRFQQQKVKVQPLTYLERQKMQEEMDRQTNVKVLKRELFNDTMQLPIKFAAYYMTKYALFYTSQQTFWAELIRSVIDASNHLILFGTNFIDYGPNKRFPYGIEKVKHMIAIIPSTLFFYFGSTITYESIVNFYNYNDFVGEIHGSSWGLGLYLLSISIETSIVLRNIKDAQNVDSSEPDPTKRTFISTLKDLFAKKDPLLQAILYENAITLMSTLVPLISSIGALLYPTHLFEIGGSFIIGLIQLNLAYHLAAQNLSSLMGEQSIGDKEVRQILEIITQNENVFNIQNEKAVMVGSRNFRFTAEITFNISKINQAIQLKYKERFLKIIYADSYKDREEYLSELLQEVQEQVFARLHTEIQSIEGEIREKFPNCIHLDFEINQKQLAETYTIDDGNSLFGDELENSGLQFEKWMLEEADRLIKKFTKKRDVTYFESYETYCRSIDYSVWKQLEEDDEEIIYHEDFRFEELSQELKEQ